ncbi:DHH family protein [Treponema primitia ZAS-2]|uniref:DHH family protein n=1 Tax=Treponema primitia (strain ATCC BAA-887 / DSM 12427 / ZAS-2) TaxID=545694 RepID=F5YNS8_TREPZ|nr:CBS domain-containing protein [Treponema primitia]AEF84483.1 DHH family protein [Treponema primitia ZAS-2]
MNIAFGHTNMDLDCLGSLILIKKLFPDFRLVRSGLIHPAAQNLYTFYTQYFDFLTPKDIKGETIENIIIVDTCKAERVSEYFACIRNSEPQIRIYDHHHTEQCNILGAVLEGGKFGANTSLLGKMAMERGIRLLPEEATIALTGIYADTGRLIFENVGRVDFEVSAWLMDMGASLKLVKSFLETIREDEQIQILNQILQAMKTQTIQGHEILLGYLELSENTPGLAAVVEKVMDIHNPDACFAVFSIPKSKTILLIARSQKLKIDLHELLHVYGGGGHQLAASAKISGREGPAFYEEFISYLEQSLTPATRAADVMTKNVQALKEDMSLMEASIFFEKTDLTGAPVLNAEDEVSGFISLRDIMKGRKAAVMNAPVRAYMSKPAATADSNVTMREIERIFYKHHIGHLPIVEDKKLVGIVTRWDYLQYKKRQTSPAEEA